MRATGLGVVVEVGPESTLEVGDHVAGPWGPFPILLLHSIHQWIWIFILSFRHD